MFIGRTHETAVIKDALDDHSKAQLIILYGRRRIGKSTLIRESLKQESRILHFEGIEGESTDVQIRQFLDDLSRQTGRARLGSRTWPEVFQGVAELIESGRWVLVFDEFPWMGASRTAIVSDLKLYWDRWRLNPGVVLFLCGSVASFMTRHVVHSKALHNRKTLEIRLDPLSPREAGGFIRKRGLREKAQLYMCLGGVPKYLEQVNPQHSVESNLNRLCFSAHGFFINEYETLFKEQFRSIKTYEAIAEELSRAPASISDLSRAIGTSKGGGLSEQVQNLVHAQFIREYIPVSALRTGASRTRLYKLTDPFLLFYFRYIKPNADLIARNKSGENLFRAIAGPTIAQYYGYSFERLGEDAMPQILAALGITLSDISGMGPYFQQHRNGVAGLQIDWLIKRRDNVMNILEFKYRCAGAGVDIVREVQEKIAKLTIPATITVEPVLVTAEKPSDAVVHNGYFRHIITLDDLV